MAKVDKKGRSKGDGKHVRCYEWMLACPAYRSLSCYARCLLTELKRLYRGDNNGELYLSVRHAASLLNASANTARKALFELEDRGFIRPKKRGSFSLKVRHATTWILTEYPVGDDLATKDFMQWQPPEKQNPVSRDDTDGITRRYRDARAPHQNTAHGITRRYRRAKSDALTVSRDDTQSSIPGRGT